MARISRRRSWIDWPRSSGSRSGRSRQASVAAMRRCFCSSVRRAAWVGCAVSTISTSSAHTAWCSRSGVTPVASARANASAIGPRAPSERRRSRRRRTRWCCSAMLVSDRKWAKARASGSASAVSSAASRLRRLSAASHAARPGALGQRPHLLDQREQVATPPGRAGSRPAGRPAGARRPAAGRGCRSARPGRLRLRRRAARLGLGRRQMKDLG